MEHIRANTAKAAMLKDLYLTLHSSIERKVRGKKPFHNANASVNFHIHRT